MKWSAIVVLCALPAASMRAQDSVVEITEEALNRIVGQLGHPSDGGIFTATPAASADCGFFGYLDCPQPSSNSPDVGTPAAERPKERIPLARCRSGDGWRTQVSGAPVPWQWWVTDAGFHARARALEFSAKVRYRVGDTWDVRERTVGATVAFDPATNQLRFILQDFKVPLTSSFVGTDQRITEVDVGKLYGLAMVLEPRRLQVPTPSWPRSVTARAAGTTAQYEAGMIRVNLDLAFQ